MTDETRPPTSGVASHETNVEPEVLEVVEAVDRPARAKGGAPVGNTNAMTHGAFLDEAKRGVRMTRDRHRRAAERDAREVLKKAGLEDDPLARMVAKQLQRLETQAGRLEAYIERRGAFRKDGTPSPAFMKLTDVVDRLLGEARHLLDDLRDRRESSGMVIRVEYAGGGNGDDGGCPRPCCNGAAPVCARPCCSTGGDKRNAGATDGTTVPAKARDVAAASVGEDFPEPDTAPDTTAPAKAPSSKEAGSVYRPDLWRPGLPREFFP